MSTYHLECVNDHSSKFYEIAVLPCADNASVWYVACRYGRIGDEGNSYVVVKGVGKQVAENKAAQIARTKMRKGYVVVDGVVPLVSPQPKPLSKAAIAKQRRALKAMRLPSEHVAVLL